VNAGLEANVFAGRDLSGYVTAGTDADLSSFDAVFATTVNAGGDAYVWALAGVMGLGASGDAAKSMVITSYGDLLKLNLSVTAGGSIVAWALRNVDGSFSVGTYAEVGAKGDAWVTVDAGMDTPVWTLGALRSSNASRTWRVAACPDTRFLNPSAPTTASNLKQKT
jgi:hypothetical protein